jgi:predicted regulator of Ras-like GTPase activity (Roadblock/LC7/MglB family)
VVEVLEQLNSVPGVVGSLVCGAAGELQAAAFPQLFDTRVLAKASAALAASELSQHGGGNWELIDVRCGEGRIVVKPLAGAYLLLLCAKTVDLQVLGIALAAAAEKLEKSRTPVVVPGAGEEPEPTKDGAAPPVAREVQLVAARLGLARSGFEQLGVVAVSQQTARHLCAVFGVSQVAKLRLSHPSSGVSARFPVMIISDDEGKYDERVILSSAIERQLRATAGDRLTVAPEDDS